MSYNKILTNTERKELQPLIDDMYKTCTEMMSRKIEGANVQQAFVVQTILDLIKRKTNKILCVGSYEDTSFAYLNLKYDYQIDGIDPSLNISLENFVKTTNRQYDISYACSVIEHVQNDEYFLKCMIDTIKDGGYGILTCDFNNSASRVPTTCFRAYTTYDLDERLRKVLEDNNCKYIDKPDWNKQPYQFEWEGIRYDFATMVFKKGIEK